MLWLGYLLKEGHAQCRDDASRITYTIHGTARSLYFSPIISVTVKLGM